MMLKCTIRLINHGGVDDDQLAERIDRRVIFRQREPLDNRRHPAIEPLQARLTADGRLRGGSQPYAVGSGSLVGFGATGWRRSPANRTTGAFGIDEIAVA